MKKLILFLAVILLIYSNVNFNYYTAEAEYIRDRVGNYNKNYAIIIDYSKHSSLERMVLIDLRTAKIIKTFKVANGIGFSNVPGSHHSSLGLSVTTSRGYSNWGINVKYVLKGLDKTNSNIRSRNVVLHSWWGIQVIWIYPINMPKSQGCPTVSNRTMRYLDDFIKKQKNKQILIYSIK